MTLDLASKADYLILLLPEIVLSAGAMAILMADVWQRGSRGGPSGRWVGAAAVGSLLLTAAANAFLLSVDGPGAGAMMAVDAFRVAANFVFLAAALLGLLFSADYLDREGLRAGEYHVLVLLATVGMMVLAGARDLIVLFIGLELMSLAVYVLTGFNREDPRSAEAGLKYFLVGAFASAFLLYGIALLYGATGTTNLGAAVPGVAARIEEGGLLLPVGVGLLLVGFGYKIAAVPFHVWAPDAYEGAPTPVTGFMAAGVKAAAFVALLRIVTLDLAPAADVWGEVLWWVALLTMIVPNLVALAQDDVKRMLAYSSIAHAGYLLVGVVAANDAGRSAVLFYLAVYTLMTLGAFAVVYRVAGKGDRRSTLDDFAGLGWERPLLGVAMVLFLLSLAGFPPTGGFVGKLFLLQAAVAGDRVILAVVLVLTTILSYFYYLRVVWKMYFEEAPEEAPAVAPAGGAFRLSAVVCAAGVLLLGLFPNVGIRASGAAVASAEPGARAAAERAAAAADATPAGRPVAGPDAPGGGPGDDAASTDP